MAQPALEQHFYPMHSGPFTPEDREAMPEDGRRVELIDGCLVVSSSAGRPHNDLVMRLFRLLDAACGVPAYWLADPARPRLTVLELEDGRYVERAVVEAGGEVALSRPYALTLRL